MSDNIYINLLQEKEIEEWAHNVWLTYSVLVREGFSSEQAENIVMTLITQSCGVQNDNP